MCICLKLAMNISKWIVRIKQSSYILEKLRDPLRTSKENFRRPQ